MAEILCQVSLCSLLCSMSLWFPISACSTECWLMEAAVFPLCLFQSSLTFGAGASIAFLPSLPFLLFLRSSIWKHPREPSVCITYFVWHSFLSWLGLAVSVTPFIQWGISSAVKPSLSLGSKVCLSEGRARTLQVLYFRWELILGIVFSVNE